jgi:hypothetical protein
MPGEERSAECLWTQDRVERSIEIATFGIESLSTR